MVQKMPRETRSTVRDDLSVIEVIILAGCAIFMALVVKPHVRMIERKVRNRLRRAFGHGTTGTTDGSL